MLVIEDALFETAVQQLRSLGFRDWTWSYGCVDPNFYQGRLKQNIYRSIVHEYSNLDQNSARFLFPLEQQSTAKVVLLPFSYTHLHFELVSNNISSCDGNIYYPDGNVLLQSFVQTLVRESVIGMWTSNLEMWSISYVYGELMFDDDVLDSCNDEEAKAWFNKNIQRFDGGIDRFTCTKRLGRVGYDEALARSP
ncbi:hypothetical protein QQS21_000884 [Conoideocrella luteorostrata]|uniref:Uncharacterized protein n=1 Tax=Conoideocrella luteorostrata TaxID=1105319 RepID=A0AAJ0FY55_9HYPO|nr:hypothetical protein QQS21_000884 [Conoideocrella luteorostrata]